MEWYSWYICGICTAPGLIIGGIGLLALWGMVLDLLDWVRR